MNIPESVKSYWAYDALRTRGYRFYLKKVGTVRDDDDFKVIRYVFTIRGNGYKVEFIIENSIFIIEGSEIEGWQIYDDGEMINEYVDFDDGLEQCVQSSVYYFYSRY